MSEEKSQQLEGGAYEVIRARLEKGSSELQARMGRLNEQRQEVFGSVETALVSTERVSTEHSCVPRDIIAIGHNRFLFGYNIQFGLKATTSIEDVFNVYDYDQESHTFSPVSVDEVLSDSAFLDDFKYLYKYYRQAVFVKFMVIGPNLYMGLRIGKTIADLKAFKWLMKGDGTLEYIGNRFDHEYQFPPQQEFEWKRAHRDMQRPGEHPHVSIEDRVFVETVGGDLTIKVEDNTETGSGIYEEPVTEADQTLDEYKPWAGTISTRQAGTLVSMDTGPATAYSLLALEGRGTLFVNPTEEVYTGMVIGENSRADDLPVNPVKAKKLDNIRSATKENTQKLAPALKFSLERAIEYIAPDELVEVTPNFLRLRKRILDPHERKRAVKAAKAEG